MKTIVAQLVKLSLLCTLLGCHGDDPIRPNWFPEGWGEVNVLLNGKQWSNAGAIGVVINNHPYCSCKGYLSILFYKFSADGYNRQAFVLDGIPTQKTGRYPLTQGNTSTLICGQGVIQASYFTSQDDGDVGKSTYSLDDSKTNYLTINAYDSTTRQISGTFQASFTKRPEYVNDDPATVTFENGQFSSPIAKKGRFE